MALKFAIAGGGTGGHVTPALALGEAISQRGDEVVFIGSDQGIETRLVPDAGFELVALRSRQVMGRGFFGRAMGILAILAAVRGAHRALRDFGADGVISVGGYAAMPASIAAVMRRTPLFLVTLDAIPGRVARLSARYARIVFSGFDRMRCDESPDGSPDTSSDGPAHAPAKGRSGNSRCFGVPLRRALTQAFANAPTRRKPEPPFRVLVFGGSQGARQINEAMMAALPLLKELPLEIVHQSGTADRERVASAYALHGVDATVLDFEPDMPSRYLWADIAICRAGALTVAELALAGLPALLIPYPFASDDHQSANAEELAKVGAAQRIQGLGQAGEHAEVLYEALAKLLARPETLLVMSAAARGRARPDAALAIVDECAKALGCES